LNDIQRDVLVPYRKKRLLIGTSLSLSQKIRKLLPGSQINLPVVKITDGQLYRQWYQTFFVMPDQFLCVNFRMLIIV